MKKLGIIFIVMAGIDVIVTLICGCKDQMTAAGWALVCAGIFVWLGLILLGISRLREKNMGF
ncbi:MAG: hypothetical protein J6Y53_01410 [Alphaproteobacteria bacterium]|nr:hypothetical protein [Alphaproteobacteria bacterium]